MTLPRLSRRTALHLAAAALLALLAFLFLKTELSGYKGQSQALALLRELKDLDARGDLEATRIANDLSGRPAVAVDNAGLVARIFTELEQPEARKALGAAGPALRAAAAEKRQVLEQFRALHARSVEAANASRQALRGLAAEIPAARARNPRMAEPLAGLSASVDQVSAALRANDIETGGALEGAAEARLATLPPAARASDPALAASAMQAEAATRAFLAARAEEAAAWRRVAFHTFGGRVHMAARDMARAIDETLVEKDLWRTYLVAYAAALLLGIGYLVARLIAADAALRQANEGLEKRVAERTRELSAALDQLKESESQLVQSEKMSSLGMLVAGVAHEINTPLAYVKSNVLRVRDHLPALEGAVAEARALLALMQSESADPEALGRAFASLTARLETLSELGIEEELPTLLRDGVHGIDEISELVTNLRNFSRIDRSRVSSFNLNDGVKAAFLIARPMLRKVDVEKHLGEIPAITCSPSQVNQVILNLVTNAVQAIDKPRGRIAATTRAEGADAVAIEITDNGKGIPPENMPRIFDPFFTTKEVGKGTGLGLSIAYKIVSQHGGRIDVRSTPGEGSTFTVILPVNPPAGVPEERDEEAVAS